MDPWGGDYGCLRCSASIRPTRDGWTSSDGEKCRMPYWGTRLTHTPIGLRGEDAARDLVLVLFS